MGYYKKDRGFHEARWDEPIIMEIGNPGERGVLVPKADERVVEDRGKGRRLSPRRIKKKEGPKTSGDVSDAGAAPLYETVPGDYRDGHQY